MNTIKIKKLNENAILPSLGIELSSGMDLTCIAVHKKLSNNTILYKTGLSIQPPSGYHTEIFPRSSIVKTGHILSNSIGLIDNTYTGELLVCLTKVDNEFPDLTLPFCLTQLVLRKANYFNVEEVEDLDKTKRGDGGFGSTNK